MHRAVETPPDITCPPAQRVLPLAEPDPGRSRGAGALLSRLLAWLGSLGLACSLVLVLLLLTFLGTIQQGELGLHETQRRYFDSFLAVFDTGLRLGDFELRVPLPGGQLVLWLLCVNLIVGGVLRLRYRWRTAGVAITHLGVLVMLVAGFVKYYHSDDGHLTLWEGERAAEFQSFYRWEVAITRALPDGQHEEHKIPGRDLIDLAPGERRTFRASSLPFDLVLGPWMRNSQPVRKAPRLEAGVPVVDGWFLEERPAQLEAEANIAGCYATIVPKDAAAEQMGILWGYARSPSTTASSPWVVSAGGTRFAIELRHERYPLPFTLQLEDFRAKFHPRTQLASAYESTVTKIRGDDAQQVVIRMNEPLREGNYVVFQSSYGPEGAGPGESMFSKFSVVRNPSDQWPLYSCLIMLLGLCVHFLTKLERYMRAEARRIA